MFSFAVLGRGGNVGDSAEGTFYSLHLARSSGVDCLLSYVCSADNLVDIV